MVRREGGRWDVSIKDNAVHIERVSEGDERLFDDGLTSEEARALAGLLTKYADKLDKSADSDRPQESDNSDESGDSDKSEDAEP